MSFSPKQSDDTKLPNPAIHDLMTNGQQQQHAMLFGHKPEVVKSAAFQADTDDEDFNTSTPSAACDYDADTDCEDYTSSSAALKKRVTPSSEEADSVVKTPDKKRRKEMNHSAAAHYGGLCVGHGANTLCSSEGCTNHAYTGGVCARHGAKGKQCSNDGCINISQAGAVVCWRHGAKVNQCSNEGCTNKAIKGGVCRRHGAKRNKKDKEETSKNTKPFSLKPVPSFYHQDLQRVKTIQSELVRFSNSNIYEKRELLEMAQASYENAYEASVSLQQVKAKLARELTEMTHKHQYDLAGLQQQAKHQVAQARAHWTRRQWQLDDTKKTYGEEGALVRSTCNDILLEAKDRVVVRLATPHAGSGSPQTANAAFVAKKTGDDEKEEVANTLGHIVDCVDRRYMDMLANHSESFIPPPVANENTVVVNNEAGETLAEKQKRESAMLKAKLDKADEDFAEAEQKRTVAWSALTKAKSDAAVAPTTTKARRSAPAPARQSRAVDYPQQQQQQQQQQQHQQQAMQAQRAAQVQAQMYAQAQYQQMQMQQQQHLQQQQMPVNQTAAIIQAQVAQQQQNAARVSARTQVVQQKPRPTLVTATNADGSTTENGEPKKMTQNERYGYGDRYSSANVQARKNPDGTVFPVQQPKLMPNGEFARPSGRQRKGMDWDGKRGCWFPVPGAN